MNLKPVNPNLLSLFMKEDIYLVNEGKGKGASVDESGSEKKLEYFGEFKKQLLVLVEDNENAYLSESSKEFFENILKAIEHTYKDIALLNLGSPASKRLKVDFQSFADYFDFTKLIIFGDLFNQVSEIKYPQKYHLYSKEGQTILLADSLDEIKNDIEKKKKLWEALKAVFSVKKP
ncbi:MAG: hypothetical protein FVQ77_12465 [Cytophagales bacterium]|nr:hypothetical protein [Cytophagales bacterium]